MQLQVENDISDMQYYEYFNFIHTLMSISISAFLHVQFSFASIDYSTVT